MSAPLPRDPRPHNPRPPFPLTTTICSVCEQNWLDHLAVVLTGWRAERLLGWGDDPDEGEPTDAQLAAWVRVEDCVAVLVKALRGPQGPPGPPGVTGPMGPKGDPA